MQLWPVVAQLLMPMLGPLQHIPLVPSAARPQPLGRAAVSRSGGSPMMSMRGRDEEGDFWGPNDDNALRDFAQSRGASVARLGKPRSVMEDLEAAWVLIFNAGQSDEGVYTLQGRAARASAYVLAFERPDDATRFATLLQAEGFDLATPLHWNTNQLSTFCDAGEFELSLVPQGTLITPPSKNEYDRDAFDRLTSQEQSEILARGMQGDPERRYPGDGSEGADAFAMERMRLEGNLQDNAINCPVEEGCEYDPNNPGMQ